MRFLALLRGSGSVEIAAYGVADAEDQVTKELSRALPGAKIELPSIHREGPRRIVESFTIGYQVRIEIPTEAEDRDSARRKAMSTARDALRDTRFARIAWDRADLRPLSS